MLKIFTFGQAKVFFKEELLQIPRKALGLLVYLASRAPGVSRETLANVFWPKYDFAKARTLLYQRLYLLSTLIPDYKEYIIYEKDRIKFNFNSLFYIDHLEFEKLKEDFNKSINPKQKEDLFLKIKDIYKAEFLEGFRLKGLEELDEWVFLNREGFQSSYLEVLEFILNYYKERKEYEKAVNVTKEYILIDPIQESANLSLMEFYNLLDKRELALRQYEKFKVLLGRHTGLSPSAEAVNIYNKIIKKEKIKKEKISPKEIFIDYYKEKSPLKLVARDDILKYLNKPDTVATFLKGESGIGKSRLIYEFIKQNCSSFYLIYGRYREIISEVPYHGIIDGLRNFLKAFNFELDMENYYINELAHFFPEVREKYPMASGEASTKSLTLDSFFSLFRSFSKNYPVVLILDDLQHADSATFELLGCLVPKFKEGNITLLASFTEPLSANKGLENLVEDLKSSGFARIMNLSRIKKEEFAEITHDRKFIDILYKESEGLPLYFSECVQSLILEEKVKYKPDGRIELLFPVGDIPVSAGFKNLILKILNGLSDKSCKLAEFLSTIGEESSYELMVRLYDLNQKDLIEALSQLVDARILMEKETHGEIFYSFCHKKIKDVIYNSILKTKQIILHKKNASLLEELYKDNPDYYSLLAEQFLKSSNKTKALKYYLSSGKNALKTGLNINALESFKAADSLSEGLENKEKFFIKKKLAILYHITDCDFYRALEYYNQAYKLTPDPLEKAIISRDRRYPETFLGRLDDLSSHESLKKDFEKINLKKYPPGSLDYIRANLIKIHILIKEKKTKEGKKIALDLLKASRIVRNEEEKALKIEIYKYLSNIHCMDMEYDDAARYGRKAVQMSKELKQFRQAAYYLNSLSDIYFAKEEWIKASQCLKESIFIAEKSGAFSVAANSAYNLAEIFIRLQDLKKSEKYLRLAENFTEAQDEFNKMWGYYFRCLYFLTIKDLKSAETAFNDYVKAFKDSSLKSHQAFIWWIEGKLLYLKGAEYPQIKKCFEKTINFYKENEYFIYEAFAKYDLAMVNKEKAKDRAYVSYLKDVLPLFSKVKNTKKVDMINKILTE